MCLDVAASAAAHNNLLLPHTHRYASAFLRALLRERLLACIFFAPVIGYVAVETTVFLLSCPHAE
jgi:hypothetical protein